MSLLLTKRLWAQLQLLLLPTNTKLLVLKCRMFVGLDHIMSELRFYNSPILTSKTVLITYSLT